MKLEEEIYLDRLYDELIAHIIVAGGRKFSRDELEIIPFGRLMEILYPNKIRINVNSERFK